MHPPENLPNIGYGTGPLTNAQTCVNYTKAAIEAGYRHIDTAQMYENESFVGQAIRESNVSREELFIATKIHPKDLGYEDVLQSTEESLDRLGLDTIDLLYIHWPIMSYDVEETCAAFDKLYENEYIRNVGVSNFTPERLMRIIERLESPIFANQVEMHPLLPQRELVDIAQEHGHYLVAYSPLARGAVFEVKELKEIAEKHGRTPAQISLAWLVRKQNVVAIPSTTDERHLEENLETAAKELTESDIRRIENVDIRKRIVELDYDQEFA